MAKSSAFSKFIEIDEPTKGGKDSIEMYVEAAANALTALERFDPTAVKTVKQVI